MKPLAQNSMIQNRYLVVQLIGKGGMGEVYLAVDQRLGSAVALKRTFFSENSELGNAFEREARILGRLRHPVLPKVIDHFNENSDQFLVMEHISGDDIAKRLEIANKPFPLSWVMFWADQLLDALSYLHAHEPPIIHRDIKPQNLKLTDENHIVLLDFGLSKDFDSNSTGSGLNSASVAGYSPHFAAMEQIRGAGTDARSDIYSLSATLYQMMTNIVPSDALSRADALLGGAKDPIEALDVVNPDILPTISEVILKGLAVRQDERFANAAEMQKALRRAFNHGKPDFDPKTVKMESETPPPVVVTTAPQSEASEMATKMSSDTGGLGLDATLQMDELPEEVKQSTNTAILAADDPVELETKLASKTEASTIEAMPIAAAASAGAGASAAAPLSAQDVIRTPPKKTSKAGMIIGGLLGLLILAAIAAGGGWYAYTKYKVSNVTPSPTPAPTASPAVLADIDSNSNTVQTSDANTADDNSNQTAGISPSPGTETRPTPQVVTKNTPAKSAQAPAAKATPKPKQRDDRTVILQ
ncbi:MAG: protein kinase [Pyrinomonadaceae bacterium]